VGEMALAPEKLPANFFFQPLDGPGESWHRHIADFSRPGKIQRLTGSEKISDLV